jgi:Amt family ammonium transporter
VSGLTDNEGLFYGNGSQVLDQLAAIGVVWVYSFTVTAIILKGLDLTLGLRVKEDEEELGLDTTQHGERGYVLDEGVSGVPTYTATAMPVSTPSPAAEPRTEGAAS